MTPQGLCRIYDREASRILMGFGARVEGIGYIIWAKGAGFRGIGVRCEGMVCFRASSLELKFKVSSLQLTWPSIHRLRSRVRGFGVNVTS